MTLRPSVPDGGDIGRLWAPGHLDYLDECRWCGAALHNRNGARCCATCDLIPPSTTADGTRQKGNTA